MAYPQDYLYEILVRGRPDGSFAAHQITATIVAEGVERAGSPAPLDLAQVAAVLGAAFPDLATRRQPMLRPKRRASASLRHRPPDMRHK